MRLKTIAQLLVLALLVVSGVAQAQATRTWVSGVGDDANPCSRTAPCKTFAGAISKTAPGGEIDVLDPGGFGALTITKSISIEADGLIAGVLVSGTNAFVINTPAGSAVMIRGITFEGLGTGLNAVNILSPSKVIIEKCHINGFIQNGVQVAPSSAGTTNVLIKDTLISNSGDQGVLNLAEGGLFVNPPSGSLANVDLENVTFVNDAWGIRGVDGANITVNGGGVFGSTFFGMRIESGGTTNANLFLNSTNSSHNATSGLVVAGPKATARLNLTAMTMNQFGISIASNGVVNSFNNNPINGNTTADVSGGTVTTVGFH